MALCACALVLRSDALPPATLGDVVANAASSLNSMKVRILPYNVYILDTVYVELHITKKRH